MLFFSLNFIISFGVYRLDIYMVCRTIPLMMALSLAWPPPPPIAFLLTALPMPSSLTPSGSPPPPGSGNFGFKQAAGYPRV